MKKVFCLSSILATMLSCSGGSSSNTGLAANAKSLVPSINESASAAVKINAADPNFVLTGIGSIPVLIYGDYATVSGLNNDAIVGLSNLEGVFSNAVAIVDAIPTSNAASFDVEAVWQGDTFNVAAGVREAASATEAISPFDFGANSGSTTYEYYRSASTTCPECDYEYTADMAAVWKDSDNLFSLLYVENSGMQKYVIQGNFNSSTKDLKYNQASISNTNRVRIEIIGNVGTEKGLIRVLIINDNNKISAVSYGKIDEGNIVMKVKAGTDLSIAQTKWICFNAVTTTVSDFIGEEFSSEVGVHAGGKYEIRDSSTFTGACANDENIATLNTSAAAFFSDTDSSVDENDYFKDLK